MSEHTQGKLSVRPVNYPMGDTGDYDGSYLVTADGGARVIEIFDCNGSGNSDTDEQNIRRIAAAWNACQGIPTEVLEAQQSGGLPWSVADQIGARVVQAEMLAAMLHVADYLPFDWAFDSDPRYVGQDDLRAAVAKVRAAIARATGGKTT